MVEPREGSLQLDKSRDKAGSRFWRFTAPADLSEKLPHLKNFTPVPEGS